MAKTKEQKGEILEKLKSAFKATSAVFVHFTGLSVSDEAQMRAKLKEEGATYFVAKKTLIKKALGESGVSGEIPALDGEIAIAYSIGGEDADPTVPARGVQAFKTLFGSEKLSIVGGTYEGALKDSVAMNEIATIPPLQVLRGMFVNVINSPIQGLAIVLKAVADKKQA